MEIRSTVSGSGPAVTRGCGDHQAGIDNVIRARPRRPDESEAPATVSVVIPCFNYARFLRSSVHSALSQTGVDVDVVIVDDESTDGALDVARGLAAEYPAVRVLAHETNQGPVATFNDGLNARERRIPRPPRCRRHVNPRSTGQGDRACARPPERRVGLRPSSALRHRTASTAYGRPIMDRVAWSAVAF